jgi:hypothetical protein
VASGYSAPRKPEDQLRPPPKVARSASGGIASGSGGRFFLPGEARTGAYFLVDPRTGSTAVTPRHPRPRRTTPAKPKLAAMIRGATLTALYGDEVMIAVFSDGSLGITQTDAAKMLLEGQDRTIVNTPFGEVALLTSDEISELASPLELEQAEPVAEERRDAEDVQLVMPLSNLPTDLQDRVIQWMETEEKQGEQQPEEE